MTEKIEFLCAEEDFGVIPKPFKAGKNIPDWFKALPMKLDDEGFNTSTVKRCMPFLDALTTGWIIPLAADVHFVTTEDGGWQAKWNYPKDLVGSHSQQQISTDRAPNPLVPRPALKWLNYWMIKTPPEYSLLFVPPLNRKEERFTVFSGIVDQPYAEREYINFPFTLNDLGFRGIIPAGTPLVQVIPFKKDDLLSEAICREFTFDEIDATEHMRKIRSTVHESIYRDNIHKKV